MHLPNCIPNPVDLARSAWDWERSLRFAVECIGAVIELFAEVLGGQRTTCDPTWRPAIVYIATILAVGIGDLGLGEG